MCACMGAYASARVPPHVCASAGEPSGRADRNDLGTCPRNGLGLG